VPKADIRTFRWLSSNRVALRESTVVFFVAQLTRNARVADPGNATGQHSMERAVATGTVKWFNPTKGYGFIQPQSGGKDVFVHISALERAGLSNLNEGATVDYEVISDRGKESAGNLRVRK
jgi:CspA family cold shock protein